MAEVAELKLHKVIGYNGSFNNTVLYTKDGHYLIYSLGLTVVIRDLRSNAQGFLHGHTDIITCLTLSNNGRLLASGQQSKSRGNKAPVLVWDLQAAIAAMASKANQSDKVTYRLVLHMGKVQDMAFSSQDNCLFTVGGQDDNALVCWNMETGEPICGTPAGDDSTLVVRAFRQASNNELLVTGGNYAFNVWRVDHKHRKFHPLRANLGNLKRIMSAIAISPDDKIAYVGTKTGDVLEIILDCDLTKPNCAFPPVGTQKPRYNRTTKERFSQGINTVAVVEQNQQRMLLLGAGDGSIAMLLTGGVADGIKSTPIPTGPIEKLQGGVTAVAEGPPGVYFIGTNQSNMYAATVDSSAIKVELRATCHYGSINDIVFPKAPSKGDDINSNLFVTCSKTDIRIWNARKAQEILRIQVPNLVCNCVDLTVDGSVIVSGWDDGKVRAFYPESGKLKFVIQDAHNESVTAIAVCNDTDKEWRLITGGKDGRVRVWRITPSRQTMEASMKEHRGPVNSIQVVQDNSSCVSASSDGQDNIYSCISWNLESFTRVQAMFASTVFRRILYHPDESQLLTCGSDRRVTYYDSYDGEAIRILEEAAEGELLALDIERSGNLFVTGGRDSTLKVWHYDNGEPIAVGKGHSEAINAVKISPDRKHIVTVGSEGAIMIWEVGSLLAHLDN